MSSKAGMAGLLIFAGILAAGVLGPISYTADPLAISRDVLLPLSSRYPFGTDALGRDVFSQFNHGLRTTLFVGLIASLIAGTIGTIVGTLSGYYKGAVDIVLQRITETVIIIPMLFVGALLLVVFGRGLWIIIIVIGLFSWPSTARISRAQVLSLRERPFVVTCRALGMGDFEIMFRQILPNALAPVLVTTTIMAGRAMFIEAALSFLGLSDATTISLGWMLQSAQQYFGIAWWLPIFPGVGLSFAILSINLVADGLRKSLRLD